MWRQQESVMLSGFDVFRIAYLSSECSASSYFDVTRKKYCTFTLNYNGWTVWRNVYANRV